MEDSLAAVRVLRLKVHTGSFDSFITTVCSWAGGPTPDDFPASLEDGVGGRERGRYVCVAPVALCMENFHSEEFRKICDEADLVAPDGIPIVWAIRKLGFAHQQRVAGPDLMLALCQEAAKRQIPIGLYGGTETGLQLLQQNLAIQFSQLQVAYAYAPPFRVVGAAAPPEELAAIRSSGAQILFVGIGCPKQELWMAQNRAHLPLVMLGVGAAFQFHSGELQRAPRWMQGAGLEWLFRLLQEPRRLCGRYFRSNFAFLWYTHGLSAKTLKKYWH